MEKAGAHLEQSLEEFNARVNSLEDNGDSEELLEAYVNRGHVLSLMGLRTSAMDDMESASIITDNLESDGAKIDAGTFVKIHTTLGSILFDQGSDPIEEYCIAAVRLKRLKDGSRHYDRRGIIRMCIEACQNLIDSDHPEECMPYIEKGLEMCDREDDFSRNRRMELYSLEGEALDAMNDVRGSIDSYSSAIDIGLELLDDGALNDVEGVIEALVMRAAGSDSLDMQEQCASDLGVAVDILEEMLSNHALHEIDALIDLHQDLAGVLLKMSRVEEAEKHMIRAMEIGVGNYRGSADMDIHIPMDED